jgi:hypothetical protein
MFGTSVAISGDTAIVGAPNEDSEATGVNGNQAGEGVYNSGAAYVFSRSGATWTQQAYLKAGTALPDRGFGWSLASSGDTLIVGAYSPWNNANTGAVCVFSRTGTVWSPQAQLDLPLISTATGFGSSVAISGNLAVAGAPEKSNVSDTGITTSKAGSAYTIDLNVDVLPPAISVKQGGVDYAKGATKWFGFVAEGDSFDSPFSVSNLGQADLILTGTPKVVITGSSDFTVTQQPDSPVSGSTGSTTFNVRFTPTSGGSKSALLSIASNDGIDAPFVINLTGGGLSFTIDTDGDGLSDAMELKTSALGFNWQVKQTASVNAYLASANRAGRYAESQVHALRLGATQVTRDQASGRIKLTTHWQKSTNLVDFFDLAAPAGSQVSINPSGGIEFEFPSPDDAAFLKVESE